MSCLAEQRSILEDYKDPWLRTHTIYISFYGRENEREFIYSFIVKLVMYRTLYFEDMVSGTDDHY